jgi:hypothetical protein
MHNLCFTKNSYYTDILQNFTFGKEIRLYSAQQLILSHVRDYQLCSDLLFRKKARRKSFNGFLDSALFMALQVSMYVNICRQLFARMISIGDFSLLSNSYVSLVAKTSLIFTHIFIIRKSMSLISDYYGFLDTYATDKSLEPAPCIQVDSEKTKFNFAAYPSAIQIRTHMY